MAIRLLLLATLPCVLAFSPSSLGGRSGHVISQKCEFTSVSAIGRQLPKLAELRAQSDTNVPSADWRRRVQQTRDAGSLAQKVFATDERPIILYDGICNLCNGGVNFMLDWDSPNEERGNFRFAALQSDVGNALLERSGRRADDVSR